MRTKPRKEKFTFSHRTKRALLAHRPAGNAILPVSAADFRSIFRATSPRRHADAPITTRNGERADAYGRAFDIGRTVILTVNGSPAADATITNTEAFATFTRVHFCSPIHLA